MSCWRALEITGDHRDGTIPPLLIKPQFSSNAYTVFLTDLSNIWCEELHLSAIVRRAAEVESPIEVTERDTAQLAILFENVRKSLDNSDDASCSRIVTRDGLDDLVLYTTISLPEPLDSLTWKFHLRKKTAVTLKNELILPLLVSSHVQHERLTGLQSIIAEKDRAITRLVDQFESSNLDLAAAFPSIGNVKSGRRVVKREQAAKHVPALQNFEPNAWKKETAEMTDTGVSTLGLFREALSECTPIVPQKLKSADGDTTWWRDLDAVENISSRIATLKKDSNTARANMPKPAQRTASDSETEDEDTEDEFETHENFKTRDLPKKQQPATTHLETDLDATTADEDVDMDRDSDDDEDLDAPIKSQSQSQNRRVPMSVKSPTPEPSPRKSSSPPVPRKHSPPKKAKGKGFKIGGMSKKEPSPSRSSQEAPKPAEDGDVVPIRPRDGDSTSSTKPVKKGFKIGGRSKAQAAPPSEERTTPEEAKPSRASSMGDHRASVEPSISSRPAKTEKQVSPVEEKREETEEEKVERKRLELKRKNEELAKKQAQNKKKKRF